MKELKDYLKIRWIILKASIINTFQIETAYWANNWGNIVSTTIYAFTYLLFIDVIYANVDTIAGYTRDEMLFFFLVSQIWFYFAMGVFWKNYDGLTSDINTGNLDMLLTKPIPSLFYASFRKINLLKLIRDAFPPSIAVILAISWENLSFDLSSFIFGLIIMILGLICTNSMQLVASLPAFWIGEGTTIFLTFAGFEENTGHLFPYEGWKGIWRVVFTTVLPVALSSGVSASVILGKSEGLTMLLVSFIIAIIFMRIKVIAWNFGLRNYTSASS